MYFLQGSSTEVLGFFGKGSFINLRQLHQDDTKD